jgi:hypothetical protein
MLKVLQEITKGGMPRAIEPSGDTSYFTFPNATEIRTFRERGLKAI